MTRGTDRRIGLLLLAAALLAAGGWTPGCSPANAGPDRWLALGDEKVTDVPDAELFHSLIMQSRFVNQNQAYHAFIVWMNGTDENPNFGKRIVWLQDHNILDRRWVHHPLKPLTRGRVASMVCRKLNLKTSVNLWLFGPYERAARRELVAKNIMLAGGGDYDTVNGPEFVNILKRADEYRLEQNVAPAGQTGVE